MSGSVDASQRKFKQTLADVTLTIPLIPGTRAKSLSIEFKPKHLKVTNIPNTDTLVNGELYANISEEGSTWWIEDNKELFINLEKRNQQEWWPHVLITDPKIDTKQIKPEASKLSDLDPETRATVEKMMFDQQQKQMGLPTSEELQKQKTFNKFKEMHPELDFSNVKGPGA